MKQGDDKQGYSGPVITLASASNIAFTLLFPVSEENASMINYILETKPEKININTGSVGIYKTMIDSWTEGNRFLSGITMDSEWDDESEEEIITVKMILSDCDSGMIESVARSSFIHAIMIAAMERKEIIVSESLLKKLIPSLENDDEDESDDDDDDDSDDGEKPKKSFPSDKDILDIAKRIMSGNIK